MGAEVQVGSGWWVCSLGVFPPSEQMELKEFSEWGGVALAGEADRAVFLSEWSIHKTPPLSSPDGTGHCLVSPISGVRFSQS